jgi:hypothetical protein
MSGDDSDQLGPALSLRYVIPVGRAIRLSDARTAVITSVEVWGDEVVFRWREKGSREERRRDLSEWEMSDDTGMNWRRSGGGGHGGGDRMDYEVHFDGSPSVAASALEFTLGNARVSVPIPR